MPSLTRFARLEREGPLEGEGGRSVWVFRFQSKLAPGRTQCATVASGKRTTSNSGNDDDNNQPKPNHYFSSRLLPELISLAVGSTAFGLSLRLSPFAFAFPLPPSLLPFNPKI
jgi:hypothetical protein